MKAHSLFAGLISAVLFAPVGATQNLLTNPGFESGFAGWTAFGNAFAESSNPPEVDPLSGTGEAKLFGNFSGGFDVSGIFQQFPANVGDQFTIDAWSRMWSGDTIPGNGPPGDNWLVMKMAFFDGGGTEIGGSEGIILDGTSPTDTWIDNAPVTGTAPPGTVNVQCLILFLQPGNDGGAAHIDDVSFTAGSGGGGGPINFIRIDQIDFDMESTGFVPASEYGELYFDYQPLPPGNIGFLNIVARNPLLPLQPPVWLLQNVPLLSQNEIAAPLQESGRVVDLSGLGVVRGVPAFGLPIELSITLDPFPIPLPPPFIPQVNTVLGQTVYKFGGRTFTPEVPAVLELPLAPNRPAWNGDLTEQLFWHEGFPNFEQGDDQCGPAGLTNSMHWMDDVYREIDLNGQTPEQTLAKFKQYTNFVPPTYNAQGDIIQHTGISDLDAVKGKLAFSADPNKTIPDNFIVKYQADSTISDLDAPIVIHAGRIALRDGLGGAPDVDFILEEMACGADVEVGICWLDNDGNVTGGHIAAITGILRLGNKTWVWTNDDAIQGRKDSAGVPPANGGLRTALCHQVTIENGGYMRFSGFAGNNRITATYSEKLDPQPAFWVSYGNGCPPTQPLTIGMAPGDLPIIGSSFTILANNVPGSAIAGAFAIGFAPALVDLSILNMTGCSLYTLPDATLPIAPLTVPTSAINLSTPLDPALSGLSAYTQALVIAPLNPFGVITSNGLELVLGY